MKADGTCWYLSTNNAVCDTKLKDDQQLVDLNDIYNVFNNVEVKSYTRNDIEDEINNKFRRIGFIAQDFDAITSDTENFKSLVK